MSFTSHYLTCAGREIHYTDWQPSDAIPARGTVIAWHGLARTGRDMDELAGHLSTRGYRVICPDTLGRGLSQWSPDPQHEYCLAFYARLARTLVEQLGIETLHWVGTSMGGAIGMVCASGYFEPALKGRIQSLVLNDNAPQLAQAAIERIKSYAGSPPAFATVRELEAFFRQVYQPYGWLSDAQWTRLTETSTRRLPDGRVTPHYDPAIVQQLIHYPDDYAVWHHFDAITIPVLCLRGAHSDLVLRTTTDAMMQRGPGAAGLLKVVEIEGCGHAPALNVPLQLDLVAIGARQCTVSRDLVGVRDFLDANHLQGYVGGEAYTLLDPAGKIVAVAVFAKVNASHGDLDDGAIELARYCVRAGYRVRGGLGKLMAAFARNQKGPVKVVSYSDNRWSIGNLYRALGFEVVNEGTPSYWYFRAGTQGPREHRYRWRKDRCVEVFGADPTQTEWQIMRDHGYDRVWDCGTTKWVKVIEP